VKLSLEGCPPVSQTRIADEVKLPGPRVGHVFFRFGASGLQELVQAEEFAAEGAGVGGPLGFARIDGQCCARR